MIPNHRAMSRPQLGPGDQAGEPPIMHKPVGTPEQVDAARRVIAAHAVDAAEAAKFEQMIGVRV